MNPNQERRNKSERRSGIDRRTLNPPKFTGIDKRFDTDCRSGEDRRENFESWSEIQLPCDRKAFKKRKASPEDG